MHFVFLYFCFAYMCSYLAQWVDIFDIFVTLTLSTVNSFSIVLEPWGWNNHKYIFEHSLWQYLECNLANLAHFAPSISSGAIKYKVHLYLWNLLWNVALGDNFPSSKLKPESLKIGRVWGQGVLLDKPHHRVLLSPGHGRAVSGIGKAWY